MTAPITGAAGRLVLLADRLLTTGSRDGAVHVLEDAALAINPDGSIDTAGPRARYDPRETDTVLDCGDRTLLPGLIDAHVHFFGVDTLQVQRLFTDPEPYRVLRAARDARTLLESGFTAVRCLGSSVGPHLARAVSEGLVRGPRIVAAGQFICSTAGAWDDVGLPPAVVAGADMLADGEDACRAVVRRRIRAGAGVVKVGVSAGAIGDHFRSWADEPHAQQTTYSVAELRAVVDEAHRHQIKVSAHAIGDDAVRAAVRAGVDVVEHGHAITPETRELLAAAGVTVVPTLTHMYLMSAAAGSAHGLQPDLSEVADRHLDEQLKSFGDLLAAGVTLAVGSDLIGPPWAEMTFGTTELELMVRGGMTTGDALRAATVVNAHVLGIADQVGDLLPGMRADVVAVPGNPLVDIRALRDVDLVVKDGRVEKNAIR